jgi:DNA-directed RNA polymerase subunit RPC12/RpoP
MFRCLECGKEFKTPLEIEETHGERWHLCPHCKENHYKPFVKDEVSRRKILEKMCEILASLNTFESLVTDVFNSTAFDDTAFDWARSDLYELICRTAGDLEFDLPVDIDKKLFDMRTEKEVFEAFSELTKNIEK